MMGAKNLVPANYPHSLENCLCYPQNNLRVVATRMLRVRGSKSGSFTRYPPDHSAHSPLLDTLRSDRHRPGHWKLTVLLS